MLSVMLGPWLHSHYLCLRNEERGGCHNLLVDLCGFEYVAFVSRNCALPRQVLATLLYLTCMVGEEGMVLELAASSSQRRIYILLSPPRVWISRFRLFHILDDQQQFGHSTPVSLRFKRIQHTRLVVINPRCPFHFSPHIRPGPISIARHCGAGGDWSVRQCLRRKQGHFSRWLQEISYIRWSRCR